MVKMRLRRAGAKKQPFYRVIVADERSPRGGRFIDEIGYYNPLANSEIKIDADRLRIGSPRVYSPPRPLRLF